MRNYAEMHSIAVKSVILGRNFPAKGRERRALRLVLIELFWLVLKENSGSASVHANPVGGDCIWNFLILNVSPLAAPDARADTHRTLILVTQQKLPHAAELCSPVDAEVAADFDLTLALRLCIVRARHLWF
jgi:hypothetical protein